MLRAPSSSDVPVLLLNQPIDFDGPQSWYLNASETGESAKCPRVGVVEGTVSGKNRETVLFLVFEGRGRFLTAPLIIS